MPLLLFLAGSLWSYPNGGDTLLVGYTEAPPFIFRENGELRGLNLRIFQEAMGQGSTPYKLLEMDFQEIVQSLETGVLDVSIAPLSITGEHHAKFDFTAPYYTSHSSIAVRKVTGGDRIRSYVSRFFNSNLLRGILILFSVIFIFGFLGWYFEWKKNPDHFRKGLHGIWDGIWWSAVTLTTVGYGDKAPKTVWGKVAALLLMFGGLLFVSGISAGIATSITSEELSNQYSSLSHFKKEKVGTLSGTETEHYLKTHFFSRVTAYADFEKGLDALGSGDIKGFMFDEEILKSEVGKLGLTDQIHVLPIQFDGKFYAFGVAKGRDSLNHRLSKGILRIRDKSEWQMILHEYGLSDFN